MGVGMFQTRRSLPSSLVEPLLVAAFQRETLVKTMSVCTSEHLPVLPLSNSFGKVQAHRKNSKPGGFSLYFLDPTANRHLCLHTLLHPLVPSQAFILQRPRPPLLFPSLPSFHHSPKQLSLTCCSQLLTHNLKLLGHTTLTSPTQASKDMNEQLLEERAPLRSLRLRKTITSSPTVTPTRDPLSPTLPLTREMPHP